ncbi:MAG: hypothetical protein LBC61_05245 [Candidatus Peribacteria bacterium]|nr:hypothetical protein [Candidatus Peribacteria bacterium]
MFVMSLSLVLPISLNSDFEIEKDILTQIQSITDDNYKQLDILKKLQRLIEKTELRDYKDAIEKVLRIKLLQISKEEQKVKEIVI